MDTTYMKQWTITVKKKDIFFDMDMLSLSFSEVAGGDPQSRRDRIALDTSSDNGRRTVTRLCDHRLSDVRQALKRFIDNTTASTANNALASGDYVIALRVPTEAEDNTLQPITDLIHEYIVNGALADYYRQVGAGNTETLVLRANDALSEIRELIYHRSMP